MTTATSAPSAPAVGLNAQQISQLNSAIKRAAEYLKHHNCAAQSIRAWLKRQYNLRTLQDMPAAHLEHALAKLEEFKSKAFSHSIALLFLEKNFIQQTLGCHWADPHNLILETTVEG